ncbi:uncharacterized protein LOC119960157 isoform X2 [Scyliorhinus canicula]|uniref:uncharacterized protein LOC119960157 isoform X2 n=1 Tax=Scyliorhinus canicula TaxID=7830 RepID=UPI0018F3060D|nr:uncharacterized protein LOC119960157 isoform X2 [Scyliorhinus canicula]
MRSTDYNSGFRGLGGNCEPLKFGLLGALKIVISSNSSASDIFPAAGPAGGFKFENGEIVPEAVTRGEFAVRKRKPNITSGSDGVAYFIIT